MARPSKHSAEFRSDVIAYVDPETLRTWVRDADGRPATVGASQDTEAELARLRAENARLAKAEKEWQLEREMLRRAAVYFAREMK
ncbi:hypothetical protein ACIA74_20865 [Streptomyces sp. NPDC051658]|uniref:hypothetical protein n=1 Tax=Streptomyces sp. NPDC051658 TaxID=3365667 RepID=UPI003790F994